MPLVMIAGHPCSGKSTAAALVASLLADAGVDNVTISENDKFKDRNACYRTLPAEKDTRAALRSETERALNKDVTVVLDTLNNIKGYRYELWCLARAAATKCCVLWVATPLHKCRAWNLVRPNHVAYTREVFEDLGRRFEPPNPSTRWDAPLVTVRPDETCDLASDLSAVVRCLTGTSSGQITAGPLATVSKELRPNLATSSHPQASTNLLHDLDRAAQDVITCVMQAQAAAGAGMGPGAVEVTRGVTLTLDAPIHAAELRRLKRSFLKAATSGMDYQLPGGDAAARVFAAYLVNHTGAVGPR